MEDFILTDSCIYLLICGQHCSMFVSLSEQMVNEVRKKKINIEGRILRHLSLHVSNYCSVHFVPMHQCLFSVFLAEFCLSCGKMRVVTFHPLFEGGLCQTCKVKHHFLFILRVKKWEIMHVWCWNLVKTEHRKCCINLYLILY